MKFKIDDCKYCASITHFNMERIVDVLNEIESGDLQCWNCGEQDAQHSDYNVYVEIDGKDYIIYEGNAVKDEVSET